jgi:hypothetical protein
MVVRAGVYSVIFRGLFFIYPLEFGLVWFGLVWFGLGYR